MNNEKMNIIYIVMKLGSLPQFKGKQLESGLSDLDTAEKLATFLEKHNLMETALGWLAEVTK